MSKELTLGAARCDPTCAKGRFNSGSLAEGVVRRESGSSPDDCPLDNNLAVTRGDKRHWRPAR